VTQSNDVVAVIPARSGSVRVKNKNIRTLMGHPLLAYSIVAAKNSGGFSGVFVSTDNEQYGEIARYYGAEVIQRPLELATSHSDLVGVAKHALESIIRSGGNPGILVLLMPCCPLRRSASITKHIQIFEENRRSFQLSLVEFAASHPQWAMSRDALGHIEFFFGDQYLVRSQELDKLYCPSGAIWIVRVEDFLKQGKFYGDPLFGEPLPFPDGMDIDEEADLKLAEALVVGFNKTQGADLLEDIRIRPWKERLG